jgi:hypothetical protein
VEALLLDVFADVDDEMAVGVDLGVEAAGVKGGEGEGEAAGVRGGEGEGEDVVVVEFSEG